MVVEAADQAAIAARIVGREDAGGDRVERLAQLGRGLDDRARVDARARALASTSSAVRPKMTMLSSPTCSRISILAPSSVPMVSAPLSANFMLPVPEASMPAVEICSERSAAGMIVLGQADIVVGQEHDLEQAAHRRVGVDTPGDVVDQLDDQLGL